MMSYKRFYLPAILALTALSLKAQLRQESIIPADTGTVLLSYDRYIKPAGIQVVFGDPGLENHAMDCALSEDGKWLAVEERYSVALISTRSKALVFRLPLSDIPGVTPAMNTYSGITWHTEKGISTLWWSAAGNKGLSFLIQALWDGKKCTVSRYYTYHAEPPASLALPNEILFNRENGKDYLYVVLNGNNQLIKQEADSGDTVWIAPTGVAPYGLTKAGEKIYVTNWGGRIPNSSEKNVAGVPWGLAKVDPNTGATSEGSVSVFDPSSGKVISEIVTGLHPNEITSSREGHFVYLTCSNSDDVWVIDARADTVSEVIPVRLQPGINPYFGDSPDGLGLSPDGKTLLVTNGMDNALAVIRLGQAASDHGRGSASTLSGFIPTGAYPSSVVISPKRTIYVTNLEGNGKYLPIPSAANKGYAYNSHHQLTSVSIIKRPHPHALKTYTKTVVAVNQLSRIEQAALPPRPDIAARSGSGESG